MSDDRPRPQYGEYATPEEQRARIRQPDAERLLSEGQAPAPASAPAAPVVAPAPQRPGGQRPADRIATFALLGYGLFTVLGSIPSAVDYGGFAEAFFTALGIDATLSDPAGARGWGIAAALVLGIGWLLTAVLTWRNLRTGRVSFWIPLAAGVVVNLVASALLVAPLASDPAVWAAVQAAILPAEG